MCRIMEELIEEARKEGYEEGFKEGSEEIHKEVKIEFARNLISEGSFAFEKISRLTGLSIEEVKNLASSLST